MATKLMSAAPRMPIRSGLKSALWDSRLAIFCVRMDVRMLFVLFHQLWKLSRSYNTMPHER